MKKGGDLLLNGQYVELQIKGPGSDPDCGRCVFLLILVLVLFFTQVYKWTTETEFKFNTGGSSASC